MGDAAGRSRLRNETWRSADEMKNIFTAQYWSRINARGGGLLSTSE